MDLTNKVAVVTGASSGVGAQTAIKLAKQGVSVVINYANSEKGALNTYNEIIKQGGKGVICQADITDEQQCIYLVNKAIESFAQLDVVINNAGVTHNNHLIDYKDSDWDATYKVNLYAPYKIMQKVSKNMSQKKSGSIINVTSLGAELGFPNNPAYVTSKGGLKMLTKSLARDFGKYGIRVNNLGPGYIVTEMTKKSYQNKKSRMIKQRHTLLGRWGDVTDLIGPCVFLASDASGYVTGQDIYVDGGWLANGLSE